CIPLEIIEYDLVVSVAVGVQGVVEVVPAQRAESNGRRPVTSEREVVAASTRRESRAAKLELSLEIRRNLCEPLRDVLCRIRQPATAYSQYSAGAVVLIEQRLQS